MTQSPWRAYFGHMAKKPNKKEEPSRHPFVVALSAVSVIVLIAAAFAFRFNKWYFGRELVRSLCNDGNYLLKRTRPVIPMSQLVSYLTAIGGPCLIVLVVETLALVVSLDHNDQTDSSDDDDDDSKPRPPRGPTLFIFRFLHFVGVHLLTQSFVSVLVDVSKIVFDWPRPYFLTEFPLNCIERPILYRTIYPEEMEARMGFPSHRVALLVAAAVLLATHMTRTFKGLRSSGGFLSLLILICALAPVLCAAAVLNSHENRPADVLASIVLGVLSAYIMGPLLPKQLSAYRSSTAQPKDEVLPPTPQTPATIEGLHSVAPMRLSWQIPRSPVTGRRQQPVPGFTARG